MDEISSGEALAAAKKCASGSSIDYSALTECYNGREGKSLLAAASAAWNKQFPSRATVPHTFVNDKDIDASYSTLKTALCKAGSKADACSQIEALQDACYA